jgi:hypothetical protein
MRIIVNLANTIGDEKDFPPWQRQILKKTIFMSIGYRIKPIAGFGTSFALFDTGG